MNLKYNNKLLTGFKNLDKITNELKNSSLNIIAGRTSMGKSSLAFNIAINALIKEKATVLLFSLEMSKKYIIDKIKHINTSIKTKIIIDDTPGISLKEIKEKCIKLKQKENIGLVIIDYIQLVSIDTKVIKGQQIAYMSKTLKKLAKEFNMIIIAISQLSKNPENRSKKGDDPRPILEDLNNYSKIINYADTIMLLYRDNNYYPYREKNILEVNLIKINIV